MSAQPPLQRERKESSESWLQESPERSWRPSTASNGLISIPTPAIWCRIFAARRPCWKAR
ncbi:hypothetical protein I7I53_09177 [Histoplasma capsulatum var. duboisii H88]|uniref:Uncharacterized protein n=1 Tax=Ajellomyces capsulatus (strain H88) TaxID=544711 RepID=A0A8A1LB04_AJEC8|nr:hypothetical protein I7I53_09177 [Histoplasma capsulatum var. duboisii H88]